MLDIASARKELQSKTLLDIERATALTWGARAAACLDLAAETRDETGRTQRLQEAQNYRQEALEHAAMTEDFQFLRELVQEIGAHQKRALHASAA
jgi:hypothetical protein